MRISGLARLFVVLVLASSAVFSSAQTAQPAASLNVQSFSMTGAKSGWLLASNRLFWTDTLGASWTDITPASATSVSTTTFHADGSGWALISTASGLAVARTTNSGQQWTSAAITPAFTAAQTFAGRASISFADAQNGFLMLGLQSGSAFRLGLLFSTTDGGATWTKLSQPPVGGDIVFLDAKHGFTGPGPAGDEFYSTADAGKTWQKLTFAVPAALTNVSSTATLPVFSDALHGNIIRTFATATPTVVQYTTTDGGVTWTAFSDATSLHAAAALDGSIAHLQAPSNSDITRTSFVDSKHGLALVTSGSCTDNVCTQTSALRSTNDGGTTFAAVAPISGKSFEASHSVTLSQPLPVSIAAPADSVSPDSTSVYNTAGVMGFDACSLPTTATMANWITASPYRVAGIYLGGANYATSCAGNPLTSTWVSTTLGEGWQLLPIWVGLQGPGSCSCTTFDTTSTTNDISEGSTEADSAVAVMKSLGLGQSSIIAYDLEGFDYTDYGASAAAFIQGWNAELHNLGYQSAVYSGHADFTVLYPPSPNPSMDDIWFAYYYVGGEPCIDSDTAADCDNLFPSNLSSSYWTGNHRSRQNSSGFNSTYGSYTVNVDEDWIGSPWITATPNALSVTIAGGSSSGSVISTTITNSNGDSSSVNLSASSCGANCSSYLAINCGSTCSANFAPTDTVTLTATPATNFVFSSWTGCTSTSGATCTVAMTAAANVTATFVTASGITVTKAGNGSGTVTSSDNLINCGSTCSSSESNGTTVTLTATAATGSTFASWTGCTSTSGTTCTVNVSGSVAVTATFTAPVTITVAKAGTGTGTVTSADTSINCGATCSASFAYGSNVVLTAAAGTNSLFTGWSGGGCTGTGTCTVPATAAVTVTATFAGPVTITVVPSPTAGGTITSADNKINCGSTCSAVYTPGSNSVVLTASAASGYVFTGWSGGSCTGTGTCTVTNVTASTTITATFAGPVTITVTKAGTGAGTVTSANSAISCGTTCSAAFTYNSSVVLTATPAVGSIFSGWSGGSCTGTGTCTVTATAATSITATFTGPTTLTISKSGTGTGTVTSADNLISCGSTCSSAYMIGSTVVLTATPTSPSEFASWTGCTSVNSNVCTILISPTTTTATVTFTAPAFAASLSSTSITVAAGGTATDTVSFALTAGWTGTFSTFACSGNGLPAGVTCATNPSTLNATSGSTSPLTTVVTVTVPTTVAQNNNGPNPFRSNIELAGIFLLPGLLLPLALRRRIKQAHLQKLLLVLAACGALGAAQILTGCGSSSAPVVPPIFSGTMNITYATTGDTTTTGTLPVTLTITH